MPRSLQSTIVESDINDDMLDPSESLDSDEVRNDDGDEVVEVYVAPPKSSVPRPPKELKGYARVALGAERPGHPDLQIEPEYTQWTLRHPNI